MTEKIFINTPAGRLVQGDCFRGSDKDQNGGTRTTKDGQPRVEWFIGLAIRKDDPNWPAFWSQVTQKAMMDFPQGETQLPAFAWKYVDGDAPDQISKTGCPGCHVLRLSTGIQPTVVDRNFTQLTDPNTVKRGYYVQVNVGICGNGQPSNGKPGVYMNPEMIMLLGYGEEITSGPSPEQIFANPAALPPGASATPLAQPMQPQPTAQPMQPGQIAPVQHMQPIPPQPGSTTAQEDYPAGVVPNPGFLNPTS